MIARPTLPRWASAALASLHLRDPRLEIFQTFGDADWRALLDFCDRSRITLMLRQQVSAFAPDWVRERLNRNAAQNKQRVKQLLDLQQAISQRFAGRVDFVALKGLTQAALSGLRAEDRVQYDLDLYTPRATVLPARDLLIADGYESMESMEDFPTDHLAPLIRKTGWEWRGDYFDLEIPTAIELHFRFWDPEVERLPACGVEEFWDRRTTLDVAAVAIPSLDPVDGAGYSALHLLRHLLRGDVGLFHVYELACILERHAGDHAFWSRWQECHPAELRGLEAVSFQLARSWFGCEVGPAVEEAIRELPATAQSWFDTFAWSPLSRQFSPNKDELWLHWSLLSSFGDRAIVARRRLFPMRMPAPVDAVYLDESQMTAGRRWLKRARYTGYVLSRARHHAVALPKTIATGARWWTRARIPGGQFWVFLGAAALYNLALFIFVLLYNLRLLELGFHEDFLGAVSGFGTAGAVAGTIPAAFLIRRVGLRNALAGCFVVAGGITALRAVVTTSAPLIALAFLFGLVSALWAVVIAPMVAQLVPEKRRPAAFSVFFASMIGIGIAGGWIGGRLPLWVHGKQPALLLAAGLAVAGVLPVLRLKTGTPASALGDERIYPRGGFLLRFLAPFALWHFATGSFNPFFNAYFAKLRFPVERIGEVFSAAQLGQVVTLLIAPLIISRAGLVGGIVWMMAATALGLGGLAVQPPASGAAVAYMAYMAFQWMSEPGMNTLLMNHVAERERGGAAAIMYLVAFSAQALAAFGAGALLPSAGYGFVIGGAAVLAAVAAALFRVLLGSKESVRRTTTAAASQI